MVCLENPRDTSVLPCRHLCLCLECAKALRFQSNKCPIWWVPAARASLSRVTLWAVLFAVLRGLKAPHKVLQSHDRCAIWSEPFALSFRRLALEAVHVTVLQNLRAPNKVLWLQSNECPSRLPALTYHQLSSVL